MDGYVEQAWAGDNPAPLEVLSPPPKGREGEQQAELLRELDAALAGMLATAKKVRRCVQKLVGKPKRPANSRDG